MPRNRVPSWWVTLHQAKTCLGEESSGLLCGNVGRGWETRLRPDQVRTELQRVLNEEDSTHPKRAHLPYDPSQDREQSHEKKTQDVHLGEFRRCQGWRKGILGAEGGFKPHPVEWQWPGISHETHRNTCARERGFIRPLLFPGRLTQKGNMCGEILIIQIFENHLPNSKETVIFQYSPYYQNDYSIYVFYNMWTFSDIKTPLKWSVYYMVTLSPTT